MMPLMKWHECKECGRVTIRIKGQRSTYRGGLCNACYKWIRKGGKDKEGTFKICPETGEKIPYKREKGSNRRFANPRVALVNKRRRQSRVYREDPIKRAEVYRANANRYYRKRAEGLCPRCGNTPEEGVLCENCLLLMRLSKIRNGRH